jgi:hypothetical protein
VGTVAQLLVETLTLFALVQAEFPKLNILMVTGELFVLDVMTVFLTPLRVV